MQFDHNYQNLFKLRGRYTTWSHNFVILICICHLFLFFEKLSIQMHQTETKIWAIFVNKFDKFEFQLKSKSHLKFEIKAIFSLNWFKWMPWSAKIRNWREKTSIVRSFVLSKRIKNYCQQLENELNSSGVSKFMCGTDYRCWLELFSNNTETR